MELIIFHSWLCDIGGCETVLYNMCEQLRNWYDIKVIYTGGSDKQISRLRKLVKTELYNKDKEYKCDFMIRNSAWGIFPDNIEARKNKYIQIIHADYEELRNKGLFTYKKWDKITDHIGCGEFVSKQFMKVTGYECKPIRNILEITKPINKIYKYIYAGRLMNEDKKVNAERIKTFLKMHDDNDIKYNLFIYTNGQVPNYLQNNENIIIRQPRYYDLHDEMADCDYGLLFSDAEGLPCFVQECLQYGTPCIVTDIGGCTELIKDGINGYVIPLDMNFDINKIKKIPKITNYDNGTSYKTWCDFIGGAKYKKKEIKNMKYLVKAKRIFDDVQCLDEKGSRIKRSPSSEAWIIDEERKEFLLENNAIDIIEEIPDKKKKSK